MMPESPAFAESANMVIGTLFGLYISLVLVRFLLQLFKADFYNPVSQFIVTATDPALKPLRRFIPSYGGIDVAALVLLFLLQNIELALKALAAGHTFSAPGLLMMSVAQLVSLAVNLFIITILLQAIMSWFGPGTRHPLLSLLQQLNQSIMRPFQRLIPPFSGIDISPIFAILALNLLQIILVTPIASLAQSLGY